MFRKSFVIGLLLACPLHGAVKLLAVPAYRQGMDALAAKLGEVAVTRFETALATPGLSPDDQATATLRLAEALIRAERPQDALARLSAPSLAKHPETPFWKAQALAGLGRFGEAASLLAQAVDHPEFPLRREALLTRASLLLSLNDTDGALASLDLIVSDKNSAIVRHARLRQAAILIDIGKTEAARKFLPPLSQLKGSDKQEAAYFDARLLLAEGKAQAAATAFATLLDSPEGQPLVRYHAATLGLADALAAQDNVQAAADTLLAFIQKNPESPLLDHAFRRLLQWLPDVPTPNDAILERLAQWSGARPIAVHPALAQGDDGAASAWPAPTEPANDDLRILATFYRALGLHRIGTPVAERDAMLLLNRLRMESPTHILASRALLQQALWNIEDDRLEPAFIALETVRQTARSPRWKAEAAYVQGMAYLLSERYLDAAPCFQEASLALGQPEEDPCAINAAMAILQTGDVAAFDLIMSTSSSATLKTELTLERALWLADRSPAQARAALEEFLIKFPQHPRMPEARLALVQTALDATPPDLSFAREQINSLPTTIKDPVFAESADDARLRLAFRAANWPGAIATAQQFLASHPDSPARPQVTLQLGEALFRNGDYNEARLILEKLATTTNEPARSEFAWFLAARAAALGATTQSREESLALFDKVIAANATLAPMARLEKARLLIDLDRLGDSAALLRDWLATLPPSDPLHIPAGLLLGEALYAQGGSDPVALNEALVVYDRLRVAAKSQPALLHRIQYLRGMTLELLPRGQGAKTNRDSEALDAYYSVLESASGHKPAEWEWFERCGFRALGLLEKAQRWQAAVAVAEKIASFHGPRSAEASARGRQLRLEHMIWDE